MYTFTSPPSYIFTSPNTSYLPTSIPEYSETTVANDEALKSSQWASSVHPWLGFVSRRLELTDPICSRLNYEYSFLPVAKDQNKWILNRELMRSWNVLENSLRDLIQKMHPTHNYPDYRFPEFPTTFGYTQHHVTADGARESVMRSKKAFIPLMACTSWVIAHKLTDDCVAGGHPKWIQEMVDEGVNPEWLTSIHQSVIGNFSIARLGYLINPHCWENTSMVYASLRAGIPVWFSWTITPPSPSFFEKYRPAQSNLDMAEEWYACVECDALRPHSHSHNPAPFFPLTTQYPPLPPGS